MKFADWREFAKALILTGELDPMYNAVKGARRQMGNEWASRFCLAFTMFYHVGTAARLADEEGIHFWNLIQSEWDTLPRGQESRHFRGKNGANSVYSLQILEVPPESVLFHLYSSDYATCFKRIRDNTHGFGPYRVLKWIDFVANVFGEEQNYRQLWKYLPDGSIQGLESIWPDVSFRVALETLKDEICQYDVPWGGRKCGYSEAETTACAYQTYCVKTQFEFGYDLRHYAEQFKHLGGRAGEALLAGMPAAV